MAQITGEITLAVLMGLFLLVVAYWLTRVEDWRSYVPMGRGGRVEERPSYGTEDKPGGLMRWLTTVDHKDIGIMYGVLSIVALVWGGVGALLIRAELFTPNSWLIQPGFYNAIMTTHGLTMLFLFGTPMLAAVANYFVPLLIGADDMAFPRLNAIAFWLLPPGALLVWIGFFPIAGLQPAATSWTIYTPLSIQLPNPGVDLMLLGLHISGVSTTMSAINFIATIFTKRDPDVSWANLDLFSWTVLTQAGLILFAFPLLGSALVMLLLDRNVGAAFFATEANGPILWQHLFWFFGHPEVYILVLPPMGLVSLILPRFAGRKLFGFKFVVYSTLAIGVLSFGVWAHHMFATGIDPRLRVSFMAVSLAIAVPSAVKVFNWITTMWNGKIRLTAPMLFCIGFVSNFIIGGVTGVFLASIPVDLPLTDTYYVVGHFHYILMGMLAFAVFAAIYYWFPLITGRMYQRRLATWHFWLSFVGTNVTFFAMLLLGYDGMPRRYATYLPQFTSLHQIATVGAFILAIGQLIWFWNVWQSWTEGPEVTDSDPWDLDEEGLVTHEWAWFEQERWPSMTDGGEEEETN